MSKLDKLEEKVRFVLLCNKKARDDDRELTYLVHINFYNINPYAPYSEVMRNKKIPSQESIGRCRRKLQEKDESLRGSRTKEEIRMKEQLTFIEYAKGDTY